MSWLLLACCVLSPQDQQSADRAWQFLKAGDERSEAYHSFSVRLSRIHTVPRGSWGQHGDNIEPNADLQIEFNESLFFSGSGVRHETKLFDRRKIESGRELFDMISTRDKSHGMSLVIGDSLDSSYGNVSRSTEYEQREDVATLAIRTLFRLRTVCNQGNPLSDDELLAFSEVRETEDGLLRIRFGPIFQVFRTFVVDPNSDMIPLFVEETYEGDELSRISVALNYSARRVSVENFSGWNVDWINRQGQRQNADSVTVQSLNTQPVDQALFRISFPNGVRVYDEATERMLVSNSGKLERPRRTFGIPEWKRYKYFIFTGGLLLIYYICRFRRRTTSD